MIEEHKMRIVSSGAMVPGCIPVNGVSHIIPTEPLLSPLCSL